MKSKISILMILLFITLVGMKCKKDESQKEEVLPAETQSGKDTFGCLVNGVIFLPSSSSPNDPFDTVIQSEILSIGASKSSTDEAIIFGIRNMNAVGSYDLTALNNEASYTLIEDEYFCTEGTLTVTKYDTTNEIISGTFHFKGKNTAGKIVEITEGRFDTHF